MKLQKDDVSGQLVVCMSPTEMRDYDGMGI